MSEAFESAWALLKMPYFHGTTTRNAEDIEEFGLDPSESMSDLEQESLDDLESWLEEHDLDYADFDPDKEWLWFAKDRPLATMAYALQSNNRAGANRFSPIIYEVDDNIGYYAVPDLRNDGEWRGSYRTEHAVDPDQIKEFLRFRPYQRGESYDDYRDEFREAIRQKMRERGIDE